MNSKEKADIALCNFCYRETATEACDWILDEIELMHSMYEQGNDLREVISDRYKYWLEVKKEIDKL